MIDKKELRQDFNDFFHAAIASVCHCYDNTQGLYPDKCGCDEKRKEISIIITKLIEEHKRLIKKYDL